MCTGAAGNSRRMTWAYSLFSSTSTAAVDRGIGEGGTETNGFLVLLRRRWCKVKPDLVDGISNFDILPGRCLDPAGARPTAMELLEDPFFAKPKLPQPEQARRPSGLPQMEPEGDAHHRGANHQQQDGGASSEGEEACEVGEHPLIPVTRRGAACRPCLHHAPVPSGPLR